MKKKKAVWVSGAQPDSRSAKERILWSLSWRAWKNDYFPPCLWNPEGIQKNFFFLNCRSGGNKEPSC